MSNEFNIKNIDSLGRVVIPSAIRKKLSINPNTILSFELEENKIILRKVRKLENNTVNDILIKLLEKITNDSVLLTDLDKVIFANVKKYQNEKISNECIKKIEKRKKTLSISLQILANNSEKHDVSIFPVLKDSELYGAIVIFSKDISKYEEIIELALKMYIENIL